MDVPGTLVVLQLDGCAWYIGSLATGWMCLVVLPGTTFLISSFAALNTCFCYCCMLQVIISVSQMLGNVIGLNNARFQESLSVINSYASSDKVMKGTGNYLQFCGTLWYRSELFEIVMVVIMVFVDMFLCHRSVGTLKMEAAGFSVFQTT